MGRPRTAADRSRDALGPPARRDRPCPDPIERRPFDPDEVRARAIDGIDLDPNPAFGSHPPRRARPVQRSAPPRDDDHDG